MKNKSPSSIQLAVTSICLMLLLASFIGCASTVKKSEAPGPAPTAPEKSAAITQIAVSEGMDTVEVKILGDTLLTFTSVKQPSPLGVVFYFPKTRLKDGPSLYPVQSDPVEKVTVMAPKEADMPLRIEIALTKDVPYDVLRENQGLKVVFPKPVKAMPMAAAPQTAEKTNPKPPASEMRTMRTATHIENVVANIIENGIQVDVLADGQISDYIAFTVQDPPRIVFDITSVTSPFKRELMNPVESRWVKNVRYYGYPDKVRVVLDVEKAYLTAYTAEAVETGLRIKVGEVVTASKEAAVSAAAEGQAPAWVNRIDFLSEEAGKSAVIVGTTRPVQHTLKRSGDKTLMLTLLNTNLPDYRKQPLITTQFDSAVNRIIPVQTAGMKDRSVLNLELREAVPYRVEEGENEIRIHFEASSVPAAPLAAAKLPDWKQAMDQAVVASEKEVAGEPEVKRFTGEKIALDFYETDIKNVFRILKEVSGKNFAIDNDVTGKVTLSFDKPVPWDQVMDLVLKMNGLGKIEEGEIIRIARYTTVTKEQEQLQKKEDTRPLQTEYIFVNYARAKDEVKPLIDEIKSERGKVSVNERTNQIIMTDVPEKIDRAKEIVRQVDKVTPQVMIEARIVEAGIGFDRGLGINWGMSGGPIFKKYLGGQYNYDFNFPNFDPARNPLNFSFNFAKFLGSPFDLDLQLTAEESNGHVKILSAPKVATLNNQEALISQGKEYPYLERDEAGLGTVEFKEIDLELKVTPQITNDNRISVKVEIKKDDIAELVVTPTGEVPALSTHQAKTLLLVNDGDTIVIGGVIKDTQITGERGFPWLKDIPGLGWLFKAQQIDNEKTELLVFITPKIIRLESGVLQTQSTQLR